MADSPIGVLLVNLGSPDAPEEGALRRYLAQFLGDPAVVDLPRLVWWPLLHGIILRTRPRRSAAAYARVWTPAGSPLVATTRAQAEDLARRLGPSYAVRVAMRYGQPSLESGLAALVNAGCTRFVLLPLFPQAHAATTGSIRAELARHLPVAGLPWPRSVEPFAEHPAYIRALAASIAQCRQQFPADHLLLSFHGVPERRGAVYRAQCERTAQSVARALELSPQDWTLTFQSRFGPERWLQPYTDRTALALAKTHPRMHVACPGFTCDCLETLDEIGVELAHAFQQAGGAELRLVPGLDLRSEWIDALEQLVREVSP